MRNILRALYTFALRFIPKNRRGDHLIAFMHFLWNHRRFPTNNLLFNDVLYRTKTSDEITDPLRVFVSDKEFVKLYVKAIVGDEFNVPTIRVLRSAEEARAFQYPSDCCIKPTHLSGKIILRRQNESVDLEEIARWFRGSLYLDNREANYRTLTPKAIVEPLVFNCDDLSDYKIFCYEKRAKLIQVDLDRHTVHTRKFFDTDWNEMPFSCLYPRSSRQVAKPKNLDKMLAVASSLSSHFNFVRIDLYSNGEECLVGEITNCHENASGSFTPRDGEMMASRLIFGAR